VIDKQPIILQSCVALRRLWLLGLLAAYFPRHTYAVIEAPAEMVLPANISQGLQALIGGGGGGGGASAPVNAVNMNISALDGASVMAIGPKLVASINAALRHGSQLRNMNNYHEQLLRSIPA
jgi:hypothetical protein